MPRKKLSEFRSKNIVFGLIDEEYLGREIRIDTVPTLNDVKIKTNSLVVKVDQAIKGRFKKGLVMVDRTPEEAVDDLRKLTDKGYQYALIEPYVKHSDGQEHYFALQRSRNGIVLSYKQEGGVDVESSTTAMETYELTGNPETITSPVKLIPNDFLQRLVSIFDEGHMAFMEINPLLVRDSKILPLDVAIEVDDQSIGLHSVWGEEDLRNPASLEKTEQELIVDALKKRSRASFSLESINRNGSVFLLLSGGGASLIVADEVYQQGYGNELGNYGEYSGNPTRDEVDIYTRQVLELALVSKAKKKILIIAGGVANFTDIRETFRGITDALTKVKLKNISVFVRRGGPHQAQALMELKAFCDKNNIPASVHGPEVALTTIVQKALKEGL